MPDPKQRAAPAGQAVSATPTATERTWIETREELEAACVRWRRCGEVGVDTEFVRERTFYPGLGLIQIAADSGNALVDAVKIADLEPLAGVLRDPAVTKVFHSCGEDFEVLHHRFGELPRPVFDTQIAATLAGWGSSPGYGRLVTALFGVDLPKDKTRTNWLKRPLSEAQKTYAALDVAYLIPAYLRLRDELRRQGREDWLREELESLYDTERFSPDPARAYRRIGAWRSLAPRQLAVLQSLATWREEQARLRDLPRNFVLREKALVEVARKTPRTARALAAIDSLGPRDIERHGRAILRQVRRGLELDPRDLPQPRPLLDLTPYREIVRRLRALVVEIADELSLPPEVLATKKTVETLVRRHVGGRTPVLPRRLRGWRRGVVGEELLSSLAPEAP